MSAAHQITRSTRAAKAMAHLPEHDPALASLALWCDITDAPGPTRSNADTVFIGEEFTTLALREQIGLLGHHILHIALRHAGRMSGLRIRLGDTFSPDQFNLAADALVNSVLEAGGHALPRPAVTLPSLLRDVLGDDADGSVAQWDVERLYMALNAQSRQNGSKKQDTYRETKAFRADLESSPKPADPAQEADWQGHMQRATQTSGGAGRGIGKVLANLADIPRDETPWELILRRLLARALGQHPRLSYRRPRRAWIAADAMARAASGPAPVFEPGVARDGARARIVVGVDSSSSVDDDILRRFAGEVSGIVRRVGAETALLLFDETVYDRRLLPPAAAHDGLAGLPVRRDGGTSFVDVIAQAQALDPSVIVVLSDLDGPFGPEPKPRVVWATPLAEWKPPPFGTVVSLAR